MKILVNALETLAILFALPAGILLLLGHELFYLGGR